MSGRPRKSTLIISGLFLAVLALYILFRPVQVPAGEVQPQVSPTRSSTPTLTPRPTRTTPSPTRSRSPSATPSSSVTPTGSPAPSGSQTATPPVLDPRPTTTGSPTP